MPASHVHNLYKAIKQGDADTVAAVLKKLPREFEFEEKTVRSEHTALMFACEHGTPTIVRQLLEQGALPGCELPYHTNTCLKSAARNPKFALDVLECLKDHDSSTFASLLNAHGSGYEEKSGDLYTPLYTAVDREAPDLVRYLIGEGADPLARVPGRLRTPWSRALESGLDEMVQAFLDLGCKVDKATFTAGFSHFRRTEYQHPGFEYQEFTTDWESRIRLGTHRFESYNLDYLCPVYNATLNYGRDYLGKGTAKTFVLFTFEPGDDEGRAIFLEEILPGMVPCGSIIGGDLSLRFWWTPSEGAELLLCGQDWTIKDRMGLRVSDPGLC